MDPKRIHPKSKTFIFLIRILRNFSDDVLLVQKYTTMKGHNRGSTDRSSLSSPGIDVYAKTRQNLEMKITQFYVTCTGFIQSGGIFQLKYQNMQKLVNETWLDFCLVSTMIFLGTDFNIS